MKICWVTNEVWFSKMLRFLFNESVSHVGVMFEIDGIKTAIDLNKPTGTLWSARYWLHKYSIVWEVELKLPHDKEVELYKTCEEYAVLRPYDMGGYYYGMLWGLLHKFLKIPFPKYNKWSSHTGSMCQEILVPILQHEIIKKTGVKADILDFTAMTPEMTFDYMQKLTHDNDLWEWIYNG